jgi:cephalosporin hydroxylase
MQHSSDFELESIPNEGEFCKIFRDNFHHFTELQKIMKAHGGVRNYEGSYLMDGTTLNYCSRMYEKQENLYQYSKSIEKAVEIGVNSGHSLLIMLLANDTSMFDAFDICQYSYTIPCVEYLNKYFNNRVNLHQGDSKIVYKNFCHEKKYENTKYDLFHIDGMHSYEYVYNELWLSSMIGTRGAIVVVDDSASPVIRKAADEHEAFGTIVPIKEALCWACHKIYMLPSI